jgi:hypothetical protein
MLCDLLVQCVHVVGPCVLAARRQPKSDMSRELARNLPGHFPPCNFCVVADLLRPPLHAGVCSGCADPLWHARHRGVAAWKPPGQHRCACRLLQTLRGAQCRQQHLLAWLALAHSGRTQRAHTVHVACTATSGSASHCVMSAFVGACLCAADLPRCSC